MDSFKFFVNAGAHIFRQRVAPTRCCALEGKVVEIFVLGIESVRKWEVWHLG